MRARLSGSDAFMLRMETPRAYMHTFKVAILDPATDPQGWSFEHYREDFEKRIHRLPWMRWRYLNTPLGLNHPIWVEDPEFNLDYHLRLVACPAPGDQRALCRLMSSVSAYQLDHTRPLWLTWVVEGLQGGRVALVSIIHHAYVDGVGANSALQHFYSDEPGWVPGISPPWNPGRLPSWGKRLWWGIRDWPQVVFGSLPKVVSGLASKRRLERELARSGQALPPTAGMVRGAPFSAPVSAGRCFVCGNLSLEDFRAVSRGFGVTINDVFLACTAASIRHILQNTDFDVDRRALIAGVPFGLPRPPGREMLGNHVTTDFCWIHTEIADPLERLLACARSATEMKAHLRKVLEAGADIGSVIEILPPWAVWLMRERLRRDAEKKGVGFSGNLVVSNVPGPRRALYLDKYRVADWFSGGQLFDGSNLNFTLWSYCGHANLCILTDSSVIADGWVIYDSFVRELSVLRSLVPEKKPGSEASGTP
jgi:diacylglycerol O-acyltransferase